MNEQRWLARSERWLRILLRFYPVDFRDEMGDAVVNTYRERCRTALRSSGRLSLTRVWLRALWDSLRNGLGERVRPAVSWRRSGNWGRDLEIATRRLMRAPLFMAAMVGTLTMGLGAFACRLHRGAEGADRADGVPESGRPVLGVAGLRKDLRPEARLAERARRRRAAEGRGRDRGRGWSPATAIVALRPQERARTRSKSPRR